MTDVANLIVRVNADTSGLTTGINAARTSLGTLGVAVGAAGVASVAMAAQYDQAFGRIAAISNTSAKNLETWRGQVLDLAGDTARAPVELADSLYFLSSAGIDAGQVMGVLERSSKAAAVGLGSTVDIAKITANAMNAYADSGLTAAQVTDTLVAAVREGSAEPEEFAAALGRILPVASKAGIEFDQVTASLAALSNIGLDVNEGVTAMRGVLMALEAPGTQAAQTLAEVGISTDEMRAALSEGGLIQALRLLEEATNGDIDVMRKIVPNVRALTGVFGLTGQEAAKVNDIFNRVADSTGSLNEAFRKTSETSAFKMRQALNELRVEMVRIGGDLLPVVAGFAGLLSKLTPLIRPAMVLYGVFLGYRALSTWLPALLTNIAIGFEAIGASSIAGRIVTLGGAIGGAGGLTAVAAALIPVAGMLATEWITAGLGMQTAEEKARSLRTELERGTITTTEYVASMRGVVPAGKAQVGMYDRWKVSAGQVHSEMGELNHVQDIAAIKTHQNTVRTEQLVQAQERAAQAARKAAREWVNNLLPAFDALSGGLTTNRHQWELTATEAVKASRQMARVQRTIASDLRRLDDLKIGDRLKEQIAQLGPDMVHAFVNGNRRTRAQIASSLRSYDEAYNDTKNRIRRIAPEIPQAATDAAKPKASSGGRTVGTSWGGGVAAGISSQIPAIRAAASAAIQQAIDAARAAGQIKSPSKVMERVGIDFMAGFIRGVSESTQQVIDAINTEMRRAIDEAKNAKGAEAAQWTAYANALKATIPQAKALGAAADDLADRIEKLHNRVNEFRDAIRSSFDVDLVGGLADVLRQQQEAAQALADAQERGQEVTAEMLSAAAPVDLTAYLRQQVAQMQAWGKALVSLREAGLNQQSLMEFAGQGPEALPLAQTLLASPELIGQLNAAQRDITKAMGQTMDTLVDQVFGEQIRRAADQLDRLRGRLHDFVQNVADATVQVGQMSRALEHALDRLSGRLNQLERGGTTGGLDRVAKDTTEPVVVNVYGDVVSEGDLVDKIHLGLLRKQKRTPLGLIP